MLAIYSRYCRPLLLCLLFIPFGVGAETYSYPNTQAPIFTVDLPNRWRVSAEGELLHATPPDESIYLGFWAISQWSGEVEEAVEEIISGVVDDFELLDEDEFTSNGIPFYFLEGEGEASEGGVLNVSVALFSPDGETFCIVLFFGAPEDEARYEAKLVQIIRSIRP